MTDPSTGPGTGDAGRDLLDALDEATTDGATSVDVTRTAAGLYQVPGRAHAYQRATLEHLQTTGLIEIRPKVEPEVPATVIEVQLTEQGRKLFGA